jgi:hypothetical protein
MKKILITSFISIFIIILLIQCSKDAGEGGNSTIYGKVYVKKYNSTFTSLLEEYYGADQWVFIIYGNNRDYDQKIRTSYTGTYEFKYLRTGTYHIYAFSKDSTLQTSNPLGIVKDVNITKDGQEIEVPDIVIFDN